MSILSSEDIGVWHMAQCCVNKSCGGPARGALDFIEYLEAQRIGPGRHLERFGDNPDVEERLVHGDLRLLEPSETPHRHHCRAHGAFNREGDVRGRLNVLADEREVDAALRNDLGPVALSGGA